MCSKKLYKKQAKAQKLLNKLKNLNRLFDEVVRIPYEIASNQSETIEWYNAIMFLINEKLKVRGKLIKIKRKNKELSMLLDLDEFDEAEDDKSMLTELKVSLENDITSLTLMFMGYVSNSSDFYYTCKLEEYGFDREVIESFVKLYISGSRDCKSQDIKGLYLRNIDCMLQRLNMIESRLREVERNAKA